jgi:hypothetical protein
MPMEQSIEIDPPIIHNLIQIKLIGITVIKKKERKSSTGLRSLWFFRKYPLVKTPFIRRKIMEPVSLCLMILLGFVL